jgi:hypothetical protein
MYIIMGTSRNDLMEVPHEKMTVKMLHALVAASTTRILVDDII